MEMNISPDIRYIGVDDLDIDLFENQYIVPEGMSYNSWLITDSQVAILDTADARLAEEWKHNLSLALGHASPISWWCITWNPTTHRWWYGPWSSFPPCR